ncbi:MAG TPA: dTMP kinase [Candidatus Omnitrophota bacterium]|nr:dTMP kinase [Candidatus Omnitrophota bacterium]
MSEKKFYRQPPPGVNPKKLPGLLVVIEGTDSSGRSTQIGLLASWLEQKGYAVAQAGLKRSQLVGEALEEAKKGNVLSPRTMSLFYATDFYDQLENRIISALRAGYVVLADRYIFTLMVRDIVRGADKDWLKSLYSMAVVPDVTFYLHLSWRALVERTMKTYSNLDYWESGMDLGLSRDWFDSFSKYQRKVRTEFGKLAKEYKFIEIDANHPVEETNREIKSHLEAMLEKHYINGKQ